MEVAAVWSQHVRMPEAERPMGIKLKPPLAFCLDSLGGTVRMGLDPEHTRSQAQLGLAPGHLDQGFCARRLPWHPAQPLGYCSPGLTISRGPSGFGVKCLSLLGEAQLGFLSSSWAGSFCWSPSGDHYNFLPAFQQRTATPSLTLTDPAEHPQYILKPLSVWKSVAVSQHFGNICFPKA